MSKLDGLAALKAREGRVLIDRLEVMADIGFHDFEIGEKQRLWISLEIWVDGMEQPPVADSQAEAWDYDIVVREVRRLATERRFNLQETLAHAIFDRLAALHGVRALRVKTLKPDVYPDAAGVGVEIASFAGPWS